MLLSVYPPLEDMHVFPVEYVYQSFAPQWSVVATHFKAIFLPLILPSFLSLEKDAVNSYG